MKISQLLKASKTVVCGMSGGVDSAVAALLLKAKGYNVVGLFMRNWDTPNEVGVCTADADREDAKFVCDHLRIPLHDVDFVKEYWNDVFSTFLKDLEQGYTPNPDVLCNKYIKFDVFFKHAIEKLGADAIATGHYAMTSAGYDLDSIDPDKGVDLMKSCDIWKDQTLFLSQVPQASLRRTLFPVGEFPKDTVKDMAVEAGMERIANRKESMGICFIGKRYFQEFIEDYVEPRPGRFIHIETGEVLGEHKGIHCWTLGQRTHIGGLKSAMYVAEKNLDTGDILVAPGTDHPALYMQKVRTDPAHWINKPPRELLQDGQFNAEFRFQHYQTETVTCTAKYTDDDSGSLTVEVDRPMRSLCPGQYAVFYQGRVCLGSAKIRGSGPTFYEMNHREPMRMPIISGSRQR